MPKPPQNSPIGEPSGKQSDDESGIGLDETLRRMLATPPAKSVAHARQKPIKTRGRS
jgi:hypothetical protein